MATPHHISVRMSDEEIETLDRLVDAVRAHYEDQAKTTPVFAQLAKDVTRSSALRDLLLSWKYGNGGPPPFTAKKSVRSARLVREDNHE